MIIIINFVNNLSLLVCGFFRPANLFSLLRGGVTIEFSEMRGPNKTFCPFILQYFGPNILFGSLISENSIVTPPLVTDIWQVPELWVLCDFYPNAPQIFLLKHRVAPFIVLQILNFKNFLEDFTNKLFSKSISKNGTYDNLNFLYKNKVTSSIVTFQISNISYRTCNSDVILFFSRSPNTYFSHCIAARGNQVSFFCMSKLLTYIAFLSCNQYFFLYNAEKL